MPSDSLTIPYRLPAQHSSCSQAVPWDVSWKRGWESGCGPGCVGEVLEGWVRSWKGGCGPGRVGVVLEGWVTGIRKVAEELHRSDPGTVGWGLKEVWF